MRSIRANHNMIAVSAYAKETAINTEQTLDLSLLASVGDLVTLDKRRETNKDELTGMEEADTIYDLGQTSSLSLNFEKAQPQHFALLYAFALGNIATTAAGTGYLHTITPIDGDLDRYRSLPSLTVAQRLGKIIAKERFASMFVDSVTSTFAKDSFCKVSASLKGTGKMTTSIVEETVSALPTVTSLTLAANGVAGSTAAERLDSIHQIRAELTSGVWTEVVYTAVSSATPAVITIAAPGAGATAVKYKILYAPTETAWMTFPARVSETPLRVSEMTFTVGGKWNGTTFSGGRLICAEVNYIEHRLSNNGQIEFVPCAGGSYASSYFREGRDQVLSLDREFRDYILRNFTSTNETFGAQILAEGMEFDTGHKYTVQIILPKLGVLTDTISANGKRLGEKGDFAVLQDSTYGSVIVKVKNKIAAYAA